MQHYKQITIGNVDKNQIEIISALLMNIGFEGLEETENSLQAYIATSVYNGEALKELAQQMAFSYTEQDLAAQNWNASWESNFEPVQVADFVAIRAHFHAPIKSVQHELIITPKMSFGTGHHATTYMMIDAMQQINFTHKKVFDFGTGTGVLAILAEKLGATHILAIDNDDWSIENSRENIVGNHCQHIQLKKMEHPNVQECFDVILANINKNVLLEYIPILRKQLSPNGILLMSGLLAEDETAIHQLAVAQGLQLTQAFSRAQWIALQYTV